MRRLIQVYDEECIRNAGGLICMGFDEAIFLYNEYSDIKNMYFLKDVMKRHSKTKIIFHKVDDIDIQLDEYADENTYFNLNGPDNLLNVIFSMYVERNNYNSFYLFTKDQKIIPINHSDELLSCVRKISLSIEDIIEINGSIVVSHNHEQPDINDSDLVRDILKVCDVMKVDFKHWNRYISKLGSFISKYPEGDYIPLNKKTKAILQDAVTKQLIKGNIFRVEGKKLKFKSDKCKRMMKTSGSWLEYYTYIMLKRSGYFDDVKMSLVIDYDGNPELTIDDRSEIDVICLKGLEPIFISNKAGKIKQEYLYEIASEARMFGNKNGIPVLCTSTRISNINAGIFKKAKELGIYVIDYDDIINDQVAEKINDIVHSRFTYRNQ